jgi:hypothetical protein
MPPLMKLLQSRFWQLRCGNEIELASGSRLVEGYRPPELGYGRITPGRITPGSYSCITDELATIQSALEGCRSLRTEASPRRSKERGSCYTQNGHSILLKKFLHLVFKLHLVPILRRGRYQ